MPLKSGSSKKVEAENFHELRHGQTFKNTERKEGKAAAEKQMEAIVLSKARGNKKRSRTQRAQLKS